MGCGWVKSYVWTVWNILTHTHTQTGIVMKYNVHENLKIIFCTRSPNKKRERERAKKKYLFTNYTPAGKVFFFPRPNGRVCNMKIKSSHPTTCTLNSSTSQEHSDTFLFEILAYLSTNCGVWWRKTNQQSTYI